MSGLDLVAAVILLASLPGTALFVIFYARRSPWRSTQVGRALMYFFISMLAVLISAATIAFLGWEYPGRSAVKIVLYSAVTISVWRLFFVLLKLQTVVRIVEHEEISTETEEQEEISTEA